MKKEYRKLKEEKLVSSLSNLEEDFQVVKGKNILLKKVEDMDINSLKQVMDNLANKYQNIFILLANINGDSVNFLARSNSTINAGNIVKEASIKSLGNGGGSPKFAQGAGKTLSEIDNIFQKIIRDIENE